MIDREKRVLLFGYGNPGRGDDGLGPALAEAVESLGLAGVSVDANYQLTVEDAAQVVEYDAVIFADADTSGPEPFSFHQLTPRAYVSFSSHVCDAPAVLALAEELFGKRPRGFLLGIRGYEFNEFKEELSEKAKCNLAAALKFVQKLLDTDYPSAFADDRQSGICEVEVAG